MAVVTIAFRIVGRSFLFFVAFPPPNGANRNAA